MKPAGLYCEMCDSFDCECWYVVKIESLRTELEAVKGERDELVNHLNAASNYIDTLGGVSQSYRIALAKIGADKGE